MAASAQVKWQAMPAPLLKSVEKGSNVGVAREQGCLNCCPVQWMKGQKAMTMTYPIPLQPPTLRKVIWGMRNHLMQKSRMSHAHESRRQSVTALAYICNRNT